MGVIPKVHLPDYDSTKLPISPGWILDWREKGGKFPLRLGEGAVGAGDVRRLESRVVRGRGVEREG